MPCHDPDAKCPWPDLPWESAGGKTIGICDDSMLRQCDVAWPSETVDLDAATPQIVMPWTVVNVGFTQLQPIGLKFTVTPEDGTDRFEFDRLVGFSAFDYENTNYVPQNTTVGLIIQPIALFGPYCNRALRITEIGMIQAGANAPVATVDLISVTFAGTARVTGTIFGRSIRGGMHGYRSVA